MSSSFRISNQEVPLTIVSRSVVCNELERLGQGGDEFGVEETRNLRMNDRERLSGVRDQAAHLCRRSLEVSVDGTDAVVLGLAVGDELVPRLAVKALPS